jgi:diketogulonate reductase-like aldo/keto reductase
MEMQRSSAIDASFERRHIDAERDQIDLLLSHAPNPYEAARLRNRYTVLSAILDELERRAAKPFQN